MQGQILQAVLDDDGYVYAVTVDGNCPYKCPDGRCAIYPAEGETDLRSEICRRFGDESDTLLTCRWMDRHGRIRSRAERRQVSMQIARAQQAVLTNAKAGRGR